jgi:hypothetical protein
LYPYLTVSSAVGVEWAGVKLTCKPAAAANSNGTFSTGDRGSVTAAPGNHNMLLTWVVDEFEGGELDCGLGFYIC